MIKQINDTMRRILCSCVAWLGLGLAMQAQTSTLTTQAAAIAQGREATLNVTLTNGTEISGGQFTVTLPQGITIKEVRINEERSNGHTLECRINGNSAHILFYAQPTAPLKGTEGTLCMLAINAASDMESDEYKVTFREVRLAVDATTPAEVTAPEGTLTVTARYLVSAEATEGGSVEGGGLFDAGDMVTLTALHEEGYHFEQWSDGSTDNPYSFEAKEHVTLTAQFARNSYEVIYIIDGIEYKRESVLYGNKVSGVDVPEKEGQTFSGWIGIPENMPARDVTVTGSYQTNSYTVTYIVEGEVFHTETVAYGTTIVPPEPPIKEGYTFGGWQSVPETMPAGDVTATGYFTVNVYQVTYTVEGEVYHTDSVTYAAAVVAPEAPTKEGYTFSGWSELPKTMPAEDVTVSGAFTINKYLITFKIGSEVVAADSLEYGAPIVTPKAPKKEGYTFDGWTNIPETVPARDLTFESKYTANEYLLAFIIDGALYEMRKVKCDEEIAVLDIAEREGYTLVWENWIDKMPAKDYTVRGKYIPNKYAITYIVDDDIIQTDSVTYGSTIVAIEEPTKEGYTFSGWSEVPETMPAENITISGTFTVNVYKVYYYVGEALVHTIEVTYGEIIPEYVYEPTEEGYTFLGWIGDTYETMPSHDVTYTANIDAAIDELTISNKLLDIYDLTGRKVLNTESLKSGIYIINGKKVLIK